MWLVGLITHTYHRYDDNHFSGFMSLCRLHISMNVRRVAVEKCPFLRRYHYFIMYGFGWKWHTVSACSPACFCSVHQHCTRLTCRLRSSVRAKSALLHARTIHAHELKRAELPHQLQLWSRVGWLTPISFGAEISNSAQLYSENSNSTLVNSNSCWHFRVGFGQQMQPVSCWKRWSMKPVTPEPTPSTVCCNSNKLQLPLPQTPTPKSGSDSNSARVDSIRADVQCQQFINYDWSLDTWMQVPPNIIDSFSG